MATDRASQGGGVARPLPALQVTGGMGTGNGADWFGPGTPMNPVAPPEVRGRRLDYPAGYNLQQRPRAYEAVSMEMLRAMADGYDLLRLAIETRKDQLARLDWTIQPKAKKDKGDESKMARAEELTEFFQMPDQVHDWDTWLRLLLEDLFVLDAPAVYVRPNKAGGVYGFKPLDGATIKRVIDDWADTPAPPYAAYQQNLKGLAAVNYTSDQLVYRPRNPRTNKIYGYSPVEQVIMIINIALRRETWQLNFFTSGNLPDALIGVPDDWTPDQITEFQDWFDNRLGGDASKRRGGTFVPGDVAKSFVQTKENELFGKAEEWLARVICFCFNISPQALVKEVNRATADTAKDTAEEEGLEPLKKWIKRLIDHLLKKYLGAGDFHFAWTEEVEIEAKTQSDINVAETGKSLMTINEARKSKGLEPFPDPIFDQPMFLASDGWVPADPEAAFELATRKAEMQAAFAPKTGPGEDGEDDPEGGPPRGGGKSPLGKPGAPKPGAAGKPAPKPGKDKAATKAADGSGGLGSPGDDEGGVCSAQASDAASSSPVQKYSPEQPRDDIGRWTAGGGDTSISNAADPTGHGGAGAGGTVTSVGPQTPADALRAYASEDPYTNAIGLNAAIRAGGELTSEQQATVAMLDQAFEDASTSTEWTTLYRGTGDAAHADGVIDPAFMSTSTDLSVAEEFSTMTGGADPTVYSISVPPGTPMIDMASYAGMGMEYQNEVLLPRGGSLTRSPNIAPRVRDGMTIVSVTYNPPPAAPKKLAKFAVRMPSVTSPTARRIQKSIATRVAVVLQAAGDDVAAQVVAMLKDAARKVAKADEPDHGDGISNEDRITAAVTGVAIDVEEILRRLNLTSLEAIVDVLDDELFELAVDSATKALAGIGVRVEADLVNQVNDAAVAFAKERSAELVGKRWVNGILMDNPNAAYRISDTTREMLRGVIGKGLEDNIGTPAIADAIQKAAAFSEARADLIARTEVSNANEQSKLTGWRLARDQGVALKKSWMTSGNENCCETCAANEAQGTIDLDDDFQSGDDAAPAHPNCMCVTVPEVDASAEPGGD